MKTKVRFSCLMSLPVFGFLLLCLAAQPAFAQSRPKAKKATAPGLTQEEIIRRDLNAGAVGVISGGIAGTYLHIATDLAAVLDSDEENGLRILPIAGRGGVRNIKDLLYLNGVDIAIVQSDVLGTIEDTRAIDGIRDRVQYLNKLYDAEFHILANKDIKNIEDLDGKTVNLWQEGSSTEMTAKSVFKQFRVKPKLVYIDVPLGIEKTRTGELAATFLIVGKPVKHYVKIPPASGLHLLAVKYEGRLMENYLPAHFTSEDYPNLIPPNTMIPTIASSAILAVRKWPEDSPGYTKLARFVDTFFSSIDKFRKPPRHEKWKELNLTAKIPGWTRFPHAEQWLAKNKKPGEKDTSEFESFVSKSSGLNKNAEQMSPEEKEELFMRFLKWKKSL